MTKIFHIVIIISFVYASSAFGQDNCNYENYFSLVNKALNKKHSDNEYKAANEYFKKAIGLVEFQFGKDLEEALEVSINLNDESLSKIIVYQLAKGGIPIAYFDRYSNINNFDWWREFETNYAELRDYYLDNFDHSLRKELLDLRTQDSLFNEKYHKYRRGELLISEKELVDDGEKIVNKFKLIWKNIGFPSEKNIGYFYINNKIQESPLVVTLIHLKQYGEYIFDDKYSELVCEGHLRKYVFKNIENIMSFGNGKGVKNEFQLYHSTYKKDRT